MLAFHRTLAGATLAAAAMVGCAGCAERDGAATAVQYLSAAVTAGDGAAACEVLAPETRAAVTESAGVSCPEAIIDAGLTPLGAVHSVAVYGQWARVVTDHDTVFLAAFGSGWKVVAAGCRSQGERPYDCRVQGG
ncbi:hypothetical protein EV385_5602 [Krasilnikovia cinnamomea]|uniref:Lipoprotein n=1 Tax=Krasilnikovia cinnamomea TaxID=349313 RepID=A0A4Q7ZT31_9ACTN|nr:hypothetical protein [Krasilnikovia cinnamomea]RZU53669.1 hypothetical protein EV385_5602 [Krasilnikovia cinnamomea]